jgi:hypothetical protein
MRTRKATQKLNFDRHAGKELIPLATGDQIIMKHGKDWIPGHVMQEDHTLFNHRMAQNTEGIEST